MMGEAAHKVDAAFKVLVTLDVSMAPDIPYAIQDMEDFIVSTLELEYGTEIEAEIELLEVDDYYA
jgi:hypothetical protein